MRSFTKDQQIVLIGISISILLVNLPWPPHGPASLFYHCKTSPGRQWAVEVTGAVREPGIYTFSQSPTPRQAIEKAGGIRGHPSFSALTCSKTLPSGAHLNAIPSTRTSVNLLFCQMDAAKRLVLGVPLDLNRAGLDELARLPGISRSLARRIIGLREARHGFKTWHDLMAVRGVGPRNMKKFRNYLLLSEGAIANKQSPDHE